MKEENLFVKYGAGVRPCKFIFRQITGSVLLAFAVCLWAGTGAWAGTNHWVVSTANTSGFSLTSSESLTVTEDGSIIKAGDPVSVSSGGAGTITNSGTISGTSGYAAISISAAVTGGIFNYGTISSTSYFGIKGAGSFSINGITNYEDGLIKGNYDGITLDGGGTLTSGITNSGTITGTSRYGISLFNTTLNGGIVNSGTIEGSNYGIYIFSTGTLNGGITNYGTITGGITDNSGTLDSIILSGSDAGISGSIYASGATLYLKDNADLTLYDNYSYRVSALEVGSGSTLSTESGDSATIIGNISNSGTLSIPYNSFLTINGDYTQDGDGILEIGVNGDNEYGKLKSLGTATFADNASIYVNVSSTDLILNASSLEEVITASSLVSNGFKVTDSSYLYDFTASVDGRTVDLNIVTDGSSSGTVASAVAQTGSGSASGAAVVLDSLVSALADDGSTGNSDMDTVIATLGTLSTDSEVAAAARQTLPLLGGAQTEAVQSVLQETGHIVQGHMDGLRAQPVTFGFLDVLSGKKRDWVKVFGSTADQEADGDTPGFKADSYGAVMGLDFKTDKDFAGIALGVSRTDLDGDTAGTSAKIASYQGMIYGSHDLGQGMVLDMQTDFGLHNTKGERAIAFMGRRADSDFYSTSVHLGGSLNRAYVLASKLTAYPYLSLDYSWIHDFSYTETGASSLNLEVASNDTHALTPGIGSRLEFAANDQTTLRASLGLGYDVINEDTAIVATYTGGGASFTTSGAASEPLAVLGGLGLVSKGEKGMEFSLCYDVEAREDFLGQTLYGKLSWAF